MVGWGVGMRRAGMIFGVMAVHKKGREGVEQWMGISLVCTSEIRH